VAKAIARRETSATIGAPKRRHPEPCRDPKLRTPWKLRPAERYAERARTRPQAQRGGADARRVTSSGSRGRQPKLRSPSRFARAKAIAPQLIRRLDRHVVKLSCAAMRAHEIRDRWSRRQGGDEGLTCYSVARVAAVSDRIGARCRARRHRAHRGPASPPPRTESRRRPGSPCGPGPERADPSLPCLIRNHPGHANAGRRASPLDVHGRRAGWRGAPPRGGSPGRGCVLNQIKAGEPMMG